jgi:diaminopimelate epimerase
VAAARRQAVASNTAAPAPSEPQPRPEIDCATVCTQGCIRPERCPSAEARARVEALLNGTSLDDLVSIATSSLESRTRARFDKGPGFNL